MGCCLLVFVKEVVIAEKLVQIAVIKEGSPILVQLLRENLVFNHLSLLEKV
jgi:hypothetical protein